MSVINHGFVKVLNFFNGTVNCTLYRSSVSGLRVLVAEDRRPVITTTINFTTTSQEDSGLPHTLEHLVFMGCDKYQFKGFIDTVANRLYASGTNGFTEEDHTAYTIAITSVEGLAKVLPVYLEHLIRPQLKAEHYLTEVHHINGEGLDGGVIFSELQGTEADPDDMIDHVKRQRMYSPSNPFHYSAGGTIKGLRERCDLERVIQYHKKFYCLENMTIALVGVNSEALDDVFKNLNEVETRYNYPAVRKEFVNPFKGVEFPEKFRPDSSIFRYPSEEVNGVLFAVWRGPSIFDEDYHAVQILMDYLCVGPESPFEQKFVQTKHPLCSDIAIHVEENAYVELGVRFGGIPQITRKEKFRDALNKTLRTVKFDMSRMRTLIKNCRKLLDYELEGDSTDYYNHRLVLYKNYATGVDNNNDNVSLFERLFSDQELLQTLLERDANYWQQLCNKYLDENFVMVLALPSAQTAAKAVVSQEQFIERRKKAIGDSGLEELAKKLEESSNYKVPPEEVLKEFVLNEPKIWFHPCRRLSFAQFGHLPYVFHDVSSKFVTIKVIIGMGNLPSIYHPFIQLYVNMLTELDANVDDIIYSYRKLACMLKEDFVDFNISMTPHICPEFMVFTFVSNYPDLENVMKWMQIFTNNLVFKTDRLQITCKRMEGTASDLAQDDEALLDALMTDLLASPQHVGRYSSIIAGSRLFSIGAKDASLRHIIDEMSFQFMRVMEVNVHVIGNSDAIEKIIKAGPPNSNFGNSPQRKFFKLNPDLLDFSKVGRTYYIGCSTTESSYLQQVMRCNLNVTDPRFVYARILAQYFSMCEGILWTEVRGKGLAYGAYINVLQNHTISLEIHRASDLFAAYETAKKHILLLLKQTKIDEAAFLAAKNSLIAEILEHISGFRHAADISVTDSLLGLSENRHSVRETIDIIMKATSDEVLQQSRDLFVNLFDESQCVRGMVVPEKDVSTMRIDCPSFTHIPTDSLCFDYPVIEINKR